MADKVGVSKEAMRQRLIKAKIKHVEQYGKTLVFNAKDVERVLERA